jgi:hypothetical protein
MRVQHAVSWQYYSAYRSCTQWGMYVQYCRITAQGPTYSTQYSMYVYGVYSSWLRSMYLQCDMSIPMFLKKLFPLNRFVFPPRNDKIFSVSSFLWKKENMKLSLNHSVISCFKSFFAGISGSRCLLHLRYLGAWCPDTCVLILYTARHLGLFLWYML